jgi:hypothetical protein
MQGPTISSLDENVDHINELADKLRAYMNQSCAGMPYTTCLVCGQKYYGWALKSMDCYCDRCGHELQAV